MHFSVLSNFLQWSCTTPKREKRIPIDVLVKEEKEKKKESWAILKCNSRWEFPGGLLVKTPCLHCRGWRFNPWSGNGDPACLAVRPKKRERKKENATIGLPKINSTEVKGSSPHEAIAWTSLPTTTQNWHLTTCLIVQPCGLSRMLKNRIPPHSHKFTACVCLLEFTMR